MQLTTAALALLSSVALISATPMIHARDPQSWEVTGFETGCSPGGCIYKFNISGAAGPQNAPAFNTTCQGTDVANRYQPCNDSSVSANLIPLGSPIWGVQVKHEWTSGTGRFTALGDVNITAGTTSFRVPVTQQFGVAAD
ncbi:hypothetical protein VTN00DRAFT_1950 [Thermoascus crustaceus]|uniref:uncharacterized protein n=1 Tax=Thermoascus crustaceus TaxID=5088 RepID=UPI0037428101